MKRDGQSTRKRAQFLSSSRTESGSEFKRTDAPRVTRSMRSALETLKLDSLTVVHMGEHTFRSKMESKHFPSAISRL